MQKFRFLEWQVYKDSQKLLTLVLKIVHQLPKEYRYELGSQIIRSAFSVVLNIAEGSGKISDKELNRYFDIALGSTYETLAALDSLRENQLITENDYEVVFKKLESITNQIGGFKRKIKLANR